MIIYIPRTVSTLLFICFLLQLVALNSCNGLKKDDDAKETISGNLNKKIKNDEDDAAAARSSSSRVLDPLGVWKTARNMVRDGIHRFRESLHEGVKVAHMLRDDVDEGVGHLLPSRKSGRKDDNNDSQLSLSSSTEASSTTGVTKGDTESMDFDNVDDDDLEENDTIENDKNSSGLWQEAARQGVLGGILKFIGVDSSSIGIILLNILIFVAEMVTSSMLGKDANSITDTRMLKENLMEWVVTGKNEKVSTILNEAQNHELPQHLIDSLRKKTGNKTSCVQLLICKMSPFIWGIQETVDKEFKSYYNNNSTSQDSSSASEPRANFNTFNSYLSTNYLEYVWSQLLELVPDKGKFLTFGDGCEKKYPSCKLLKFSSKSKSNSTQTS